MANDSRYGLSASVFAGTSREGEQIARRIEAGAVNVNDVLTTYFALGVPMGGWKESGIGFRHASYGIKKFVRPESIVIAADQAGQARPAVVPLHAAQPQAASTASPASSTPAASATASGSAAVYRVAPARIRLGPRPGGRSCRSRVRRIEAPARAGSDSADRQVHDPVTSPSRLTVTARSTWSSAPARPGVPPTAEWPRAVPHRLPVTGEARLCLGLRARLRAQRPPHVDYADRDGRIAWSSTPPARARTVIPGRRDDPRHPPTQLRPLVRSDDFGPGAPVHRVGDGEPDYPIPAASQHRRPARQDPAHRTVPGTKAPWHCLAAGRTRYPAPTPSETRGRDEVYALGLRNPWRYSIDPQTGDL